MRCWAASSGVAKSLWSISIDRQLVNVNGPALIPCKQIVVFS